MPQLFVLDQAEGALELSSAHVAPRGVATVDSLVYRPVLLVGEHRVAEGALELALPVNLEVPDVVGPRREAPEARLALEGFLTRVRPLVLDEVQLVLAGVRAETALVERLLASYLPPFRRGKRETSATLPARNRHWCC